MWTLAEKQTLLSAVRRNYRELKDKTSRKKVVWAKIADKFNGKYTADQCSQRWRNLKMRYKAYEDNKKRTGAGRRIQPELYDELDEILRGDHAVHPPFVVDTMSKVSNS